MDGYYCKHCASPASTPNNSDHEGDHALQQLSTKPGEKEVVSDLKVEASPNLAKTEGGSVTSSVSTSPKKGEL